MNQWAAEDWLDKSMCSKRKECNVFVLNGVPKGVMEFAMRSSTNILATPDNLRRWKKIANDSCKMCAKPNSPPHKAKLMNILNAWE